MQKHLTGAARPHDKLLFIHQQSMHLFATLDKIPVHISNDCENRLRIQRKMNIRNTTEALFDQARFDVLNKKLNRSSMLSNKSSYY